MCDYNGRADEVRRGNADIKAKIASNLLGLAEDRERLQVLLDEMRSITSGYLWACEGSIPGAIRDLAYVMDKTPANLLRERAVNDCYLGNRAAFYKEV